MSTNRTLIAAAGSIFSTIALVLGTGVANAEPPAPPLPIDAAQAPGLSAVQSLAPVSYTHLTLPTTPYV